MLRVSEATLSASIAPGLKGAAENRIQAAHHLGKARAAYKKKEYDLAIAYASEAIHFDPKCTEAWHIRGMVWGHKNKLEKMISAYEAVVHLDPEYDIDVWQTLGYGYLNTGRPEQALVSATEVIKRNPHYVGAYVNRAAAYQHYGQFQESLADVDTMITLDPKARAGLLLWRSRLLKSLGKLDDAKRDYSEAVKLDPKKSKEDAGAYPVPSVHRFVGQIGSPVHKVVFSPDGHRLYSAGTDKVIREWDTVTGVEKQRYTGHEGPVVALALSSDGANLVSSSIDQSVRLWETATSKEQRRLIGHAGICVQLHFHKDGNFIRGYDRKNVCIWDQKTGKLVQSLQASGAGSVLSENAERVLITDTKKPPILLDAQGKELIKLTDIKKKVQAVAISRDGKTSVFAMCDYSVEKSSGELTDRRSSVSLWSLKNGKRICDFANDIPAIRSLAFSVTGNRVASVSMDGCIRIWEVENGKQIWSNNAPGEFTDVVFANNGQALATADNQGIVRIYRLPESLIE